MKSVGLGYDVVRPPERGVMVLAYHRVGGGTELELDMSPGQFDEQMSWLADSGRAVSIDAGLDQIGRPSTAIEADPVVVTFDDGTVDFMDEALPILERYEIPATYYIATKFIEDQEPFPDNGRPLTWSSLADAVATGLVTVGSHTHSHAVLDKLDTDGAEKELVTSCRLIEDRLGVEARHFAYPKGVFGGDENEKVVARHFRSAALANCGVNPYGGTDPLRLERSPIQRSDGMFFFKRKVDNGLRMEGQVRATLNRRRYESATN